MTEMFNLQTALCRYYVELALLSQDNKRQIEYTGFFKIYITKSSD